MITCCEIALCLAFTNLFSLAIFAGYTIKVSQRTFHLEQKNGQEQKQIDELKKEPTHLKNHDNLSPLPEKETTS